MRVASQGFRVRPRPLNPPAGEGFLILESISQAFVKETEYDVRKRGLAPLRRSAFYSAESGSSIRPHRRLNSRHPWLLSLVRRAPTVASISGCILASSFNPLAVMLVTAWR